VALIWLAAWLETKAALITWEGLAQFLSAETGLLAFELLYVIKYFQNFRNFIWNSIAIFHKNIG
jgi:hypothetical protein